MKRLSVGFLLAVVPAALNAQSLSQRVAAAGDGPIRFSYASRPQACGDGRTFLRMGRFAIVSSGRSYSMLTGTIHSDNRCERGPAEARLEIDKGRVTSVRSVLPASSDRGGTDLGLVSASEAAKFFIASLERPSDASDERMFVALALVDSATVWPDLVRIARNETLTESRRANALRWAGLDGEAAAIGPLAGFLNDKSLSSKIRQGAAAGLAGIDEPAATRILTDFVRSQDDPKLRSHIVHIVNDDDAALATWRTMVADTAVDDEVRMAIMLVLGNSDDPKDGQLLRSLLPKMTTNKLRDRLLHAVSERDDLESGRWLLQIGQKSDESVETRKKALFWAGQSDLPIRELTAVYDRLDERRVREHMIFVISQRKESEATDKLIAIARNDADRELRKKSMFWIGQRDDSRGHAFLQEMLK